MIKLTKFSRISQIALVRLFSAFSVQKLRYPLTQSSQRAIWATAVVRKIKLAQGSDDITNDSLREQLLNMSHPSESFPTLDFRNQLLNIKTFNQQNLIFDDSIRKEILSLFSQGIDLSNNVFSQDRIQLGKDQIISKIGGSSQFKFIFCPNVLVTQPIFAKVVQWKYNHLIFGAFGVSKTVSLVLLNQLSSIINNYVYKLFQNQVLKEEYNFLKNNYLNLKVPKIFYWSINLVDDLKKLKTIIFQQATELSLEQKKQLVEISEFEQFAKKVRQKYNQKDIISVALIDQINIVASLIRQWNSLKHINNQQIQKLATDISQQSKLIQQLQLESKKQKGNKYKKYKQQELQKKLKQKQKINISMKSLQQQLDKKNKNKQQAETMLRNMKLFENVANFTIYNSSLDIEKDLLVKQNRAQKDKTLDLQNGHTHLLTFQVPYFQNLNQKWGCNDFSHYYWFQIQKKLAFSGLFSKQQLKNLKQIFYKEVNNQKWPNYIRFVNIAYMLKNYEQRWFGSDLKAIFSQEIFETTSKQLIIELYRSSRIQYQQHLKKFLKKGTMSQMQKKLVLINIIYRLAQQKNQESTQNLQISISDINRSLKQGQIQDYLTLSLTSKELFTVKFNNYLTKLIFYWTPKQFIQIVNKVIYSITIDDTLVNQQFFKKVFSTSNAAQGIFLQAALLLALRQSNVYFIYQDYKKTVHTFPIKKSSFFIQFNQTRSQIQNSKITIKNNLTQILQVAKANPQQYIFGQPKRIDKYEQLVYGGQSKSIDFLIVRCVPNIEQKEVYEIHTFDTTVSDDTGDKFKKAENDFIKKTNKRNNEAADDQKINYTINHTVIGGIYPQLYKKNQNYVISNALIKSVRVFPIAYDVKVQNLCLNFITQQKIYLQNLKKKQQTARR